MSHSPIPAITQTLAPPPSSGGIPVQVAVRIRPVSDRDRQHPRGARQVVQVVAPDGTPDERRGTTVMVDGRKKFNFDKVFGPECNQEEVYVETVEPLVERFLEGYNVTVLAYGQTGTGKTYTMGSAPEYAGLGADPYIPTPEDGIIPRAVKHIFHTLHTTKSRSPSDEELHHELTVSFLEIYNEDLIDLLNIKRPSTLSPPPPMIPGVSGASGGSVVTIREDPNGSIYWSGAKEFTADTTEQVLKLLIAGLEHRQTNTTDMNKTSSRSHAIFALTLRQQKFMKSAGASPTSKDGGDWAIITSKFNFVDLAGSERLKRTNAVGERAKEGISINSGLLALGNVIYALASESSRVTHVPYRDSKLTRLLQDSLGGNSQTVMIATVSPTAGDLAETLNTLKWANRGRNIKNSAFINHEYESEVGALKEQVARLKSEMAGLVGGGSRDGPSETSELARLRAENAALRTQLARTNEDFGKLRQHHDFISNELALLQSENTLRIYSGSPTPSMQSEGDTESISSSATLIHPDQFMTRSMSPLHPRADSPTTPTMSSIPVPKKAHTLRGTPRSSIIPNASDLSRDALVEEYERHIRKLRADLRETTSTAQDYLRQLDILRRHTVTTTESAEAIRQRDQETAHLKSQLSDLDAALTAAHAQLATQSNQLSTALEQLKNQDLVLDANEKEITDLVSKLRTLTRQQDASELYISQLESKLSTLQGQTDAHVKIAQEWKDKHAEVMLRNVNAEEYINGLEGQLARLQSVVGRVEVLEAEVGRARAGEAREKKEVERLKKREAAAGGGMGLGVSDDGAAWERVRELEMEVEMLKAAAGDVPDGSAAGAGTQRGLDKDAGRYVDSDGHVHEVGGAGGAGGAPKTGEDITLAEEIAGATKIETPPVSVVSNSDSHAAVEMWKSKADALEKELQELKGNPPPYERDLPRAEDDLTAARKQVDEMTSRVAELQRERDGVQTQLESVKSALQAAETRATEVSEKLHALEVAHADAKRQMDERESEAAKMLEETTVKLTNLESLNKTLQTTLSEAESKLSAATAGDTSRSGPDPNNDLVQSLQKSLHRALAETETYKTRIAKLESDVRDVEWVAKEREEAVKELEKVRVERDGVVAKLAQLEAAVTEVEGLKGERDGVVANIAQLEAELKESAQKIPVLEAQVQQRDEECVKLRAQMEEYVARLGHSDGESAALRTQLAALEAEHARGVGEYEAAKQRLSSLESELEKRGQEEKVWQDRVAELEAQCQKGVEERQGLMAQLEEARTSHERATAEHESSRAALDTERSSLLAERDDLLTRLASLDAKHTATLKDMQDLVSVKTDLASRIASLEAGHGTVLTEREALHATHSQLQSDHARLLAERDECLSKISKLESELGNAVAARNADLAGHKDVLRLHQAATDRVARLEQSVAESDRRAHELQMKLEEVEEKVAHQQDTARRELKAATAKLEEVEAQREGAERRWQEANEAMDALKRDVEESQKVHAAKAQEIEALKGQLAAAAAASQKDSDDREMYRAQIHELSREREVMVAEMEQMKGRMAKAEKGRLAKVVEDESASGGGDVSRSISPPNMAGPRRGSETSTRSLETKSQELAQMVDLLALQINAAEQQRMVDREYISRLESDVERARAASPAPRMKLLEERLERQVQELAEWQFEATKASKEAEAAKEKVADLEQKLQQAKREVDRYKMPPTPTSVDRDTRRPSLRDSAVKLESMSRPRTRTDSPARKQHSERGSSMLDDIMPSLMYEDYVKSSTEPRGRSRTSSTQQTTSSSQTGPSTDPFAPLRWPNQNDHRRPSMDHTSPISRDASRERPKPSMDEPRT
ncbi:hypothetical protein HK104_007174, partial [Borealophlyctis nickersoniae]